MWTSHADLRDLLPEFAQGSLGEADRNRVERHLETCGDCRADLAALAALRDLRIPEPGEEYWAGLAGRVLAEAARVRAAGGPGRLASRGPLHLPSPVVGWSSAAAAAVLAAFLALPRQDGVGLEFVRFASPPLVSLGLEGDLAAAPETGVEALSRSLDIPVAADDEDVLLAYPSAETGIEGLMQDPEDLALLERALDEMTALREKGERS